MMFGRLCILNAFSAKAVFSPYHELVMEWMHHTFFNHSSIESNLACFYFRAIMNKAAMNTHVQVFT